MSVRPAVSVLSAGHPTAAAKGVAAGVHQPKRGRALPMSEMSGAQVAELYDEMDREMVGAIIESKKTAGSRLEQFVDLAHRLGADTIGIAYCVGFAKQAEKLEAYLSDEFEVVPAGCKVHDLQAADLVEGATGTSCNPAGQAEILNDAGTDLNISIGLCLGHDMIFQKHSLVPVTAMAVKDRPTNHQPLDALE
ncbi:MAG: DUF1847 domain-containing protein [Armatimonadia bacterium]|nr:DUF1847 domain-containing protein [Armatimonadia bacterium]